MPKKSLLFFIYLNISVLISAQHPDSVYNHSLYLNFSDLFIKKYSFTYNYRLDESDWLDITFAYRKSLNIKPNSLLNDEWWHYNNLTFKAGIRDYFYKNVFTTLSYIYKYNFFNNQWFSYRKYLGEETFVNRNMSKTKRQYGSNACLGIKLQEKNLTAQIYIGISLLHSENFESIISEYDEMGELIKAEYPVITKESSFVPSPIFGFSIGFQI